MKKYFTLLAFLSLVTLVSCDKDEPGESPKKEYDVYFAGWDASVEPTYWKNGEMVSLQADTSKYKTTAVFVSNNDVYVAGFYYKDASRLPVYWKNGTLIKLPNDNGSKVSTTSLCVVGNDVYVAGTLSKKREDGGIEGYTVYWKNDVLVYLTDGFSEAKSICVVGNDVYVLDEKGYWKNGIRTELPFSLAPADKGIARATDIRVVGNDVYVSGHESVKRDGGVYSIARYWKNGVPVTLSEGQYKAEASSICISDNDVYVAGYDKHVNSDSSPLGVAYACYWKNGEPVYLSDNTDVYIASSIFVLDNNVFVSGIGNEGYGYWINDKFHPASDFIAPHSMFVVERK